jgi:hypothetical protein
MLRAFRLTIAALVFALSVVPAAQAPADVQGVLRLVGERLEQYYKRAQNVVFTEKKVMQPVTSDYSPLGFARTTEYELRVEADEAQGDGSAEVKILRQLLRVNGRPPRDKDKKDRNGCTDENPLSDEPLSFLLPANRGDYSFVLVGPGKGKDQNTIVIDFTSTKPEGKGEIAEDPEGRPDCFSVTMPVRLKGRVWVDAASYDVVRVEQRIAGIGDLPVPFKLASRHNLADRIILERNDKTIRYKLVSFHDPEETMLLPESIETLRIYRSAMQSSRTRQSFSDYRRFVTGARIVK